MKVNHAPKELIAVNGQPLRASLSATGAGFGGQIADWNPTMQSIDAAILPELDTINARADDLSLNHGIVQGGIQFHIDNIVGSEFRLSYKPLWKRLGLKEENARAFAKDVESAWSEYADDPECYIDAERQRTFTMLIRESIGTHTRLSESMLLCDWINRPGALYNTAFKLLSPKRVSNPDGMESPRIKAGIEVDRHGAAIAYHVRERDNSSYNGYGHKWRRIARANRWGRTQFIHAFEPIEGGQLRGANKFISIMEQVQMLSKLQKTEIQNAVINAMYAAVIESELDSQTAFNVIGGGETQGLENYMALMADYHKGAKIRMNGVKIPHLVPGEKLNLLRSANASKNFVDLEGAILRYTASGFGMGYEQLARDYSKTNYSSARASMLETWKMIMGKRKLIAGKIASLMFSCWFEEALHSKKLSLPKSRSNDFYQFRRAWTNCSWIGQGRLAIDGLKEVKEAVMRIEAGFSTYEKEMALMGEDYQEVFAQQVREKAERESAGLPPPSWMKLEQFSPETPNTEEPKA